MTKTPAAKDPTRNVWLQLGFPDAEAHFLKAELVLRLARISHTTACFCEVRWDFPMLQRLGMQDCGAGCAARGLMFLGLRGPVGDAARSARRGDACQTGEARAL